MQIHNFDDFITALHESGFSMGGGNSEGIYSVVNWNWNEMPPYETPVRWHTGEPDTDPWEWRMRVLNECDDIAYSKLFFRKSGYITKEWYPYFYAVRRKGESFDYAYNNGTISQMAKQIYDVIRDNGATPFHEIKKILFISKEDNSRFERALVELQMRMFITMCGQSQKLNKYGEGYGWNSTTFTTTENFWAERGFTIPKIETTFAEEKLMKQVLKLNPNAEMKKIIKFIRG